MNEDEMVPGSSLEGAVFAEVDSTYCGWIPDVVKTRSAVTPDGRIRNVYIPTLESDPLQRDIMDLLFGRRRDTPPDVSQA